MSGSVGDLVRERVAKCLGWSVEDTLAFSLRTLQAIVRDKDSELAKEIGLVIDSGAHLFVAHKPKRRWR